MGLFASLKTYGPARTAIRRDPGQTNKESDMNQPTRVSRKLTTMKRLAPLTLILAFAFTGCADDNAETTEAVEQARTILNEDCDMEGAVNNCTDWLTDLVSATYDAYDTVEDPSTLATDNYEYINDSSGVYSGELQCPETDWLESSCVARHVSIVANVETVLEEIEPN